MQVILLERIERLGQMGDVVKVKDGYARNFLLPRGKALRANDENRARFETDRAQLEAQNLERRGEAEAVAEKLAGGNFILIRQAGDSGQLYGSVTTRDIAEEITGSGFTISRDQISLDSPIKLLGLHEQKIVLHPEVAVNVTLNVARTDEEAERQSRGEDITVDEDEAAEADKTLGTDKIFEDEETAAAAEQALADDPEETDTADNTAQATTHNAGSEPNEEDNDPADDNAGDSAEKSGSEDDTEKA